MVSLYSELKSLKLVGEELKIPWQTVYWWLKKENIEVMGDKSRYGGVKDQIGLIGERLFRQDFPNCNDENLHKFQAKYDFTLNDLKIDVKTSFLRDAAGRVQKAYKRWAFSTKSQQEADFIVCYCLDGNQEEYKIINILLIPREMVGSLQTISVSISASKWLDYKVTREELVEYYIKHKGVQVVNGIETDDQCVIDCYGNDNLIVGVDKDYYACPVNFLNSNRESEGISNGNCFGKLWLNEKKEVRGYGRIFFYWQVANGDDSDWYFANSASDVKWADMGAYNALKDARNDREALQALKNVYLELYPSPKQIIGWRGDKLDIDWLYVLRENWDLARMLRFPGDNVDAANVLEKFNLL